MATKKTKKKKKKTAPVKHKKVHRKTTSSPRKSTVRHRVEVDEPRERLGNDDKAFELETAEGTDALAEELGEEFVENATGADDAATQSREPRATEEVGGPFVQTTDATEFAAGTDASNPPDAKREPLPKVQ